MKISTNIAIFIAAAKRLGLPEKSIEQSYFTTDEYKEFTFLWPLPFNQIEAIAALGPYKEYEVSND